MSALGVDLVADLGVRFLLAGWAAGSTSDDLPAGRTVGCCTVHWRSPSMRSAAYVRGGAA
jgi:hypothetical protein